MLVAWSAWDGGKPSPQRHSQVDDDHHVDEQPTRFPKARTDRELVEFERNQQRGDDQSQIFGPELIEPQTDSLDQLDGAETERGDARDPQLMRTQAMQTRDDRMEEVLARIDVDAAHDPLGQTTEVRGKMEEQIRARDNQEQAAHRSFDCDQAQDKTRARRIASPH